VVVEHLLSLPVTIVHGDFSASNVLVAETATGLRVCPVDWEAAGLGPGLTDLAALVTGWREPEVVKLADAYVSGMGGGSEPLSAVFAALDACRFQLCIQWLGWSHMWTPPAEHARDWLAEAVALAERGGW
jgi:thiamine kinase-like enzyme